MNEDQKRALNLEKTLLRYSLALENGDLATVASILEEAERDSQLEKMIFEVTDIYAAEIAELAIEQDAIQIRAVIEAELLSALPGAVVELPPLTVGNVIARIHADAALRGQIDRESLAATRAHQSAETPLPEVLSVGKVSKLLQDLGIEVGRRFQKLFRDTALYMRMGRNQGMARMAATRRQQEAMNRPRLSYLSESKASYAASQPSPPSPAPAGIPEKVENRGVSEKGTDLNATGTDGTGNEVTGSEDTGNAGISKENAGKVDTDHEDTGKESA